MAENETQHPAETQGVKRRWLARRPSLSLLIALMALALGTGSLSLQIIQGRKLESRLQDLEWANEVREQDSYSDAVEPSVGTIQFLRRGYTIELTKVNYTPGGLDLAGFIGNPTQIWISSFTLEFTVQNSRSDQRAKFLRDKSPFRFFASLGETMGKAQAPTIDTLPPGGRQPFQVTIPNVRQRQEGFQLTVAFSGDRYSYGS